MPQEFKHPRDVLAYRAFYVLRRPWGSASPSEGGMAGSDQRLGVAPGGGFHLVIPAQDVLGHPSQENEFWKAGGRLLPERAT